MTDLADRDRLQPSLFDRLRDDHPDRRRETRDDRVMTQQQLREYVLRDLTALLNTCNFAAVYQMDDYPHVAASTLNYGMRDLNGRTSAGVSDSEIEQFMRQAIWDFEPRIQRDSLNIRLVRRDDLMNNNALAFEIEGDLWGQPMPTRIFLHTEIDLDIGEVRIMQGR